MRTKDSRGKFRVPPPELLFGNPLRFDRLAQASRSKHPHLHVVLSYRGEKQPPAANLKNSILNMGASTHRCVARQQQFRLSYRDR